MRSTTQSIQRPGESVHRRQPPQLSGRPGHAAHPSLEAAIVRSLREVFDRSNPRPERAERPWSRMQLEVRREFVEAQAWARR